MCGIFGYIGKREIIPTLVEGLKKLEYRGYDSWGMTILENGKFYSEKHIGKIGESLHASNLNISNKLQALNPLKSKLSKEVKIGISHTRWATHGGVNTQNAHPHSSCNGEISVVHNGIIENYLSLKKTLTSEGHIFKSETDTEVIVHLVEKFYNGSIEIAVQKAVSHLIGTYGILVVHSKEKKIVCARNGSPMVLGLGKNEFFIASDVSPIVKYTKKVIYLEDGDLLTLTPDGYNIIDSQMKSKQGSVDIITWSAEQAEKQGYKHFMLKEIFEQPDSITNTLRGRIPNNHVKLGGIKLDSNSAKSIKRIIILGCGTSWHAGLAAEYLMEDFLEIPVEVEYASEFRYRNPPISKEDLVIAISQSGETADTLAALKLAKQKGAITMGIVNVVGSTIAREAGMGIYLHAGPEIGVASTKAFTCQVTALCLFTVHFFDLRNLENLKTDKSSVNKSKSLKENKTEEKKKALLHGLKLLPQKVTEVLKLSEKIKEIAMKYSANGNFIYLGRGYEFPVALEGALKLKEISYIHAEGYPAAEMKHGPIALIDEKMPVVFIANKSTAYEKVLSNMMEVKARNGRLIALATIGDENVSKIADDIIFLPETAEPLMPIISIIPLQLLAYYIADIRGCDVDKPRNLAKSVTVE